MSVVADLLVLTVLMTDLSLYNSTGNKTDSKVEKLDRTLSLKKANRG